MLRRFEHEFLTCGLALCYHKTDWASAHRGLEKLMVCTVPSRKTAHRLSTCVLVKRLEGLRMSRMSYARKPIRVGLEESFYLNVGQKSLKMDQHDHSCFMGRKHKNKHTYTNKTVQRFGCIDNMSHVMRMHVCGYSAAGLCLCFA